MVDGLAAGCLTMALKENFYEKKLLFQGTSICTCELPLALPTWEVRVICREFPGREKASRFVLFIHI